MSQNPKHLLFERLRKRVAVSAQDKSVTLDNRRSPSLNPVREGASPPVWHHVLHCSDGSTNDEANATQSKLGQSLFFLGQFYLGHANSGQSFLGQANSGQCRWGFTRQPKSPNVHI